MELSDTLPCPVEPGHVAGNDRINAKPRGVAIGSLPAQATLGTVRRFIGDAGTVRSFPEDVSRSASRGQNTRG